MRQPKLSVLKFLCSMVMIMVLLAAIPLLAYGTEAKPEPVQNLIESILINHAAYGEEADALVKNLFTELEQADPAAADQWRQILDIWKTSDTDLEIHYDTLPEDLPDTDELCLVALGFRLNPDGTMQPELLERLQVLLKNAEKYPNSLIVCTGGGTARNNPDATEAGVMGQWLIDQGIDPSRVIIEDDSMNTSQNAIYTFDHLVKDYPQVKQLSIISSDYHISRGTVLFEAEAILREAAEGREMPRVVSNAACKWQAAEPLSQMFVAGALIEISGDADTAMQIYRRQYQVPELPETYEPAA